MKNTNLTPSGSSDLSASQDPIPELTKKVLGVSKIIIGYEERIMAGDKDPDLEILLLKAKECLARVQTERTKILNQQIKNKKKQLRLKGR
jgi:hypothetical protein